MAVTVNVEVDEHTDVDAKADHVMPVDMKKAVVKFLREEGFYFDEWHEHIAINLIKESKG